MPPSSISRSSRAVSNGAVPGRLVTSSMMDLPGAKAFRRCHPSKPIEKDEPVNSIPSGRPPHAEMFARRCGTDAIALSKSPVSLTLGDEAPHILTRKSRLQPLEFLIISAKRLLQHNRPQADIECWLRSVGAACVAGHIPLPTQVRHSLCSVTAASHRLSVGRIIP